MDQLPVFNRLISQPNGVVRNFAGIMQSILMFNEALSDPAMLEPSMGSRDDLKPLLTVISGQCGVSTGLGTESALSIDMEAAVAKALKILLRKPINRDGIGRFGVKCMVSALSRQTQRVTSATAEVGNAILNACYDGANVGTFLELGGISPLLHLLRSRDHAVQGSALGVLQSLCFVSFGRRAVIEDETSLLCIARFLLSDDDLVRARSIGVLHNISAEVTSLRLLREAMCISPIISLLTDASPEICQAAVGALQNISREEVSRLFMLEHGVVPKLVEILFSDNMQSQICSVGALLNLLGPSLAEEETEGFCRILSDGVVLGAVQSCIFCDDCDYVL